MQMSDAGSRAAQPPCTGSLVTAQSFARELLTQGCTKMCGCRPASSWHDACGAQLPRTETEVLGPSEMAATWALGRPLTLLNTDRTEVELCARLLPELAAHARRCS